jgi:hypothetical protein
MSAMDIPKSETNEAMKTKAASFSYTNPLGEVFVHEDKAWYYSFLEGKELELLSFIIDATNDIGVDEFGTIIDQFTYITKDPGGALLALKYYYDKYGYPEE